MIRFTVPLLTILVSLLLTGCGIQSENKQLKLKVSELENEINEKNVVQVNLSNQLNKVDLLIDSISKSEAYMAFNLEMGTSYQDHVDRLRSLSAFIEYTRQKMLKLEKKMAEQDTEYQSMRLLIGRMRAEVEQKDQVIKKLRKQIADYEAENEELIRLVDLQKKEIIDIEQQLKLKIAALNKAEMNIEALKSEKEKIKADAFFEKAEANEQIAEMTKFAPKKKKEAYSEALNLYKMALQAGRKDAAGKIKEIEKAM
ncbi:MAG: hypothetical protein CMO01_05770 [Thalassobius sp.]|nr:hypothetical protein [Thalassovita sp.]|tara:strand:+ start:163 stop:930 length:768 start_codon:yes stop_codon:yes gene_type:complete